MIEFDNLSLKKVNTDKEVEFLKEMFNRRDDEDISFLGNLSNCIDDNTYVILNNNKDMVGYFSMTSPVVNHSGLLVSSLYYGIDYNFRGYGYGNYLVKCVSEYLLNKVDMLLLTIDRKNEKSLRIAVKNNYKILYDEDSSDEILMTRYSKKRIKNN